MKAYLSPANVWKRLKSECPVYFKKVVAICVALSVTGAALIELQQRYPEPLNFIPTKIGGYLLVAGLVGAFISKMTVTETDKQKNEIK